MKDYIFNRIQEAETEIITQINMASKHIIAIKHDYLKIRKRVMSHLDIKTMPQKYKDEISAILSFCWTKDVLRPKMYPIYYRGKMYDKWDKLPEELKEKIRNSGPNYKPLTVPMMPHEGFYEGMDAPEYVKEYAQYHYENDSIAYIK